MATAGSIPTIAAGTALIYQLRILGWVDLIISVFMTSIGTIIKKKIVEN